MSANKITMMLEENHGVLLAKEVVEVKLANITSHQQ